MRDDAAGRQNIAEPTIILNMANVSCTSPTSRAAGGDGPLAASTDASAAPPRTRRATRPGGEAAGTAAWRRSTAERDLGSFKAKAEDVGEKARQACATTRPTKPKNMAA